MAATFSQFPANLKFSGALELLKRDHISRWALLKHSFETNKLLVFLEIEDAFPYCDWSNYKSRIILFGSTSGHRGEVTGRCKIVFFFEFMWKFKIFKKNKKIKKIFFHKHQLDVLKKLLKHWLRKWSAWKQLEEAIRKKTVSSETNKKTKYCQQRTNGKWKR